MCISVSFSSLYPYNLRINPPQKCTKFYLMRHVVPDLPDIINLSKTPINLILFSSSDIMCKFNMTV